MNKHEQIQRQEKKIIKDIEFNSEEGEVFWRYKFADGSVSKYQSAGLETNETKKVTKFKQELTNKWVGKKVES